MRADGDFSSKVTCFHESFCANVFVYPYNKETQEKTHTPFSLSISPTHVDESLALRDGIGSRAYARGEVINSQILNQLTRNDTATRAAGTQTHTTHGRHVGG
jgi:hypothetical protein